MSEPERRDGRRWQRHGDRRAAAVSGSCEVQQVSIAKRSNCCLHYV